MKTIFNFVVSNIQVLIVALFLGKAVFEIFGHNAIAAGWTFLTVCGLWLVQRVYIIARKIVVG